VRYVSTRGDAPILGFEDVLLEGLARDGGLYLPQDWPQLKPAEIADFAGRPYHQVAADVIWPFVGDAFPRQAFDDMVREAYATFGHDAVTPLVMRADVFALRIGIAHYRGRITNGTGPMAARAGLSVGEHTDRSPVGIKGGSGHRVPDGH